MGVLLWEEEVNFFSKPVGMKQSYSQRWWLDVVKGLFYFYSLDKF